MSLIRTVKTCSSKECSNSKCSAMQEKMVGKRKNLQFEYYSVTTFCNPLRISYSSRGFKSYFKNIFNTQPFKIIFSRPALCCPLDFYKAPENRFSNCAYNHLIFAKGNRLIVCVFFRVPLKMLYSCKEMPSKGCGIYFSARHS